MYGNNTVYYNGETYEFNDEVSALRCRLELNNEDNPYASPERMGGKQVNSKDINYSNHLDENISYSVYSKPKYNNTVKTIEMPFLNKDKKAIISTIKDRLNEIEALLNKL